MFWVDSTTDQLDRGKAMFIPSSIIFLGYLISINITHMHTHTHACTHILVMSIYSVLHQAPSCTHNIYTFCNVHKCILCKSFQNVVHKLCPWIQDHIYLPCKGHPEWLHAPLSNITRLLHINFNVGGWQHRVKIFDSNFMTQFWGKKKKRISGHLSSDSYYFPPSPPTLAGQTQLQHLRKIMIKITQESPRPGRAGGWRESSLPDL